MQLSEYISKDAIAIAIEDSIEKVLLDFNELQYSHLPVVDEGNFIGMIAFEDVMLVDDVSKKIEEIAYLYQTFYSYVDVSLLEVFTVMARNHCNLVPIIDKEKRYVGYLDVTDTIGLFADTHFLNQEGVTIVLEKETAAMSISQITQIVESNANEVLGFFITHKDSEKTQLILKVNSAHINELIQTFRRYNYIVINELKEDNYLDALKSNSDYFSKYLEM